MVVDIIINNHLQEWKQIIKEIKENYNNNLEIEIEFSNQFMFNASAKKGNNKDSYLISIDKQVFETVYNFFHSTLNKENPQLVNMVSYNGGELEYEEDFAKTLADLYVYLTLKFIFLHELGHIMNGHIGYYSSINEGKSYALNMNEDIIKDFNGLSAYEYQMLEINADAFATTNIMIGLITDFYNNNPTYLGRYKKVIPAIEQLILIVITSNIISMLIQGMGVVKGEINLKESKYIPQRARLNEILKVYIKFSNEILFSENELDLAIISSLVLAYEGLINDYLIQCGYRNTYEFDNHNINQSEVNDYINGHVSKLYKETWLYLKPKLILFAYLKSEDLG